MIGEADLAESYAYCRRIIRRQAHSFYFASRFLPWEKRRDVFALYAFYRTVDDLVDRRPPGASAASVVAALDVWRRWLRDDREPPLAPVCCALRAVIDRYGIPPRYFEELLDGVQCDLVPRQLQSFAELEQYCYLVAGTVGLVMSYVLGVEDPSALDRARDLGIAMQLTNVLRDIGEDLDRQVIYLPACELQAYGYSAERLQCRTVDRDFRQLMDMQIARARAYYRTGISGIAQLPRDSQFPILLAARMYGTILAKIERGGYDVFSRRAHTRFPEKLWIASRSYLSLHLTG